jgi:hypothetical protein
MATRRRWPSRPRPTPRGIAGKRVQIYFDALVERCVPPARVSACIQQHRAGARALLTEPKFKEEVFRSKCLHRGFEWWIVEFPAQRKLFVGSPSFFSLLFERQG